MPKCFYCDRDAVGTDSLGVPICTMDANESYMRHWSAPGLQDMVDEVLKQYGDENE